MTKAASFYILTLKKIAEKCLVSVIQLKVNIITSVGQVGHQVVGGRMSSQSELTPCARGGGLGKDELDD